MSIKLFLIGALLVLGAVMADHGSDDNGQDDKDINHSVDSSGIHFESSSKTDVQNKIKIDITVVNSGGSGNRLEARLRSFTKASTTQAQVEFRAKFENLVEYVETDGVPGYSANDTVGTNLALGSLNYNYQAAANQGTTANPVYVATATAAGNVFKITAKVAGSLFNDSGVYAFTNGVKIDVDISSFTYTLAGSRLALVMGFVSQKTRFKSIENDNNQNHVDSKRVVVTSNDVSGPMDAYFSWATTVDVTAPAATANVIAGSITSTHNDDDDGDDNDHSNLVYSFDAVHPTTIHWDPFIGLGNGVGQLLPSITIVIFLCVAILSRTL